MSLRIGLVCPYAWDVPGGVQQHVGDLARALAATGHHVSVLAPVGDPGADLPEYLVPAGRPVPVPYNGSVARLSFGPRTVRRVRRWIATGDFDLLHIHEPSAPSTSLLACWAAEGPMVATFHTANPRSRAMAAGSGALRSAMEKIHGRIAVSQAARRTLVEHIGGDAVLIPNGVDTAAFAEAEPLPGWPGPGGALGFLGRVDEPRKGLATLMEAFTLLAPDHPGLRVLVAGPGDPGPALEAVPEHLRERVVCLGRLDETDRVRAFHSADLFCAPNLGGESFGMVLTEAMAAGATIAASDIPAFEAVLDGGRAGQLFATGDAADLARRAADLLAAPERRARLAEAAREAALPYDWGTVAADVVRVYETVLHGEGPEGRDRVRVASGPSPAALLRRGAGPRPGTPRRGRAGAGRGRRGPYGRAGGRGERF
ncbi:GDP-mannose-dependent alpha-(1-2)-phosphatidylinositol mannosyltransferase [Nocardiopsis kunsanensis]|uniref:GDP-mannose-dependent alpha-(1-2)-phosphatidylinositol mannosyltransferase n=1 Tax=Nocardiopsis kunsanensis TaxID=141693 RepID=A0A919CEB7_9ACTN|nr:glycosyltransferase family 4 protein [Nocardiopsis kunsanensis]GHD15068.1 GDP-mannose-dependent alpha-(1-2)-phosphatidylinositol mannosyltransferase [Nocardiopsis kunsanensis]